jgi:23S rRNA pseudouridine955/2504/2580 synthase
MEFSKFEAGPGDDGRRIDRVLRHFLPDESLSSLYSAIRKGLIRINDKRIKPETHIFQGDVLSVADFLLSTKNSDVKKGFEENILPYEIIFRNEHFLVINKPYDIPVQQAQSNGRSLAETVAAYYKSVSSIPESLSFTPGPLHRLDRKTTGVLFFSWSLEGARWFSRQISAHMLEKKYLALVQGNFITAEEWEDFIEKEEDSSLSFHTVRIVKASGKRAQTKAEPVASGKYCGIPVTLVKFSISTGRMHQIRAQSSFHGFPLLGDVSYGGIAVHEKQDFFLHSYEICIPDNKLGLPQSLKAPLPAVFNSMLNKMLINWKNSIIL